MVQPRQADVQAHPSPPPPPSGPSEPPPSSLKLYNPDTVTSRKGERRLQRRQHIQPRGSRRRRAAIASIRSQGVEEISLEQLPYQCFQEARKFLQEDRSRKLEEIELQKTKIDKSKAQTIQPQDERYHETTLQSLEERLQKLKIWADINDPLVKKRFEDGLIDWNKPVYRYLANQRWHSYKRKVLMQRITQMHVVPDILTTIEPTVSTALYFGNKKVQHGDFVDSRLSVTAPTIQVQAYDRGEKSVTIAVVNADVPDVQRDGFTFRCHFLASNIRISANDGWVNLGNLDETSQVLFDWLPAYAQKGAPYQRMSIFVLDQPNGPIDVPAVKNKGYYTTRRQLKRHGFVLKAFTEFFGLKPIGVDLFRTKWDESTPGVMQRAGIMGWDVEFKRKTIEPLPYKKLDGMRYR